MKNLLVLTTILFLTIASTTQVFAEAQTAAPAKIPNFSFEKWSETPNGFLPTKWQLENSNATNVARSNRAWDGAYSLQLSGKVTLSSEVFDYTGIGYKLSANSLSLKGGKGVVKLFRQADGLNPVCKMAIPEFQTKICVPPFPQGSRYYISITSSEPGSILVDNVTLVEN